MKATTLVSMYSSESVEGADGRVLRTSDTPIVGSMSPGFIACWMDGAVLLHEYRNGDITRIHTDIQRVIVEI